jgi:hypothetical protein
MDEVVILRLEVEYLRKRAAQSGCWVFGAGRFVGVSSNAMVEHAFGGSKPRADQYPYDEDDLAACRLAYAMAPDHLQKRMTKIMDVYRHHVEGRNSGR